MNPSPCTISSSHLTLCTDLKENKAIDLTRGVAPVPRF